MKAYFYIDKEIDNEYQSREYSPDDIIVTTFPEAYNMLKEKVCCNLYYMDAVDISVQDDAISAAKEYAEYLRNIYTNFEIDPFVNYLFSHYFLLAFNLISFIDSKLRCKGIDEIHLFGGNRNVCYTGLFLGEGEKAFNLLYKRSWFLNKLLFELFRESSRIIWEKEDNAVKLNLFKFARTKLITASKVAKIINRTIVAKMNKKGISMDTLASGKKKVLLLVRNPVQVEPLKSLYAIINKHTRNEAVFVKYGMLQKNNLDYILDKSSLNYIDLISIMDFKEVQRQLLLCFKPDKSSKAGEYRVSYKDYEFYVPNREIVQEIRTCWFENNYRLYLMDKLITNLNSQVKMIYTTETYNHNAAIEGIWANDADIPIYSIQHVGMERFKLPVDIWTDGFYYMDYELYKYKKSYIEPSSKCNYIGPISYDSIFNTSNSNKALKSIAILTQPDDFRFDFVELLDDIISIKEDGCMDFDILIKLHPRDQYYDLYHNYEKSKAYIKIVDRCESTNDLIKETDIVFSVTSGTIFQSILIGTPTVCVNYRNKYNIDIIDYLSDEVTLKALSKDDIRSALQGYDCLRSKFLQARSKYLDKYIPMYTGNAAEMLLKEHGIIDDDK